MKKPISDGDLLLTILKKDFKLYSRNSIYLFLTFLGLAFFVAVFWIVPDEVEEEIPLAISPALEKLVSEGREAMSAGGVPAHILEELDEIESGFAEEGILLVQFDSSEQVARAISGELDVYRTGEGELVIHDPEKGEKKPRGASRVNLQIGIAFPETFFDEVFFSQRPKVTLYSDANVPDELRGAMESFIRELAFGLAGSELPVELPSEDIIVVGNDRLGDQISMRMKMRPLLAFFVMMMETFALGSLISNEVLQRTVTALLVSPMRTRHFLSAKTIFGTALNLGQALVILILVGAFSIQNWSLLLVTAILGSLLFTSVAMVIGAAGKDFIGQLMYSMLFLIPLMIPSFAVLFPGTVTGWISYLPSYPIVRLLYDATVYNLAWQDALGWLGYAFAWVVGIYILGLYVLKRKVATL